MAANQTTYHPVKGGDAELNNVDVAGALEVTGAVSADTFGEVTAGAGLSADGLRIKDGGIGEIQAIAGDGAITIQTGTVLLSKGSAAAITIAAPTATTHDRIQIEVIALTAQAHVITCATVGFNAKGSSGTLTFGGAKGDSVKLRAYNGNWYVVASVNVTPA